MSPHALEMGDRFAPRDPSRRLKGLLVVVVLHALLVYALVSGLARKAPEPVKKPLAAVVIQEVIIPPPPPPPPPRKVAQRPEAAKVKAAPPYVPPAAVAPPVTSNAPLMPSVATPAPAPAVMTPAPPAPAAAPRQTGIGLACPRQVPPEMPRRALQEGAEGVVKAQIHIRNGRIVEVTILSGPRVFHAAVKAAIMQYTCVSDGDEVIATQEFNFKIE